METEQIDELMGDDVRAIGREACITLNLPISDAAFQIIDDIESELRYWLADDLDITDGRFASHCADWPSGSGVITIYTADQVRLWADLGAWQADLDDYRGDTIDDITTLIGRELQGVAYTIADAMAYVVTEKLEELEVIA